MKFKVKKDSELFVALTDFQEQRRNANEETKALLEEVGAGRHVSPHNSIGGGVVGFEFLDRPDPTHWKAVFKKDLDNVYFPKSVKDNSDLLQRIKNLTVVTPDQLNKLIDFKAGVYDTLNGSLVWSTTVGLKVVGDDFLIEFPEKYKHSIHKDLIELKNSEYYALIEAEKEVNHA